MRLYPQRLIEGGHLGDGTAVGTSSDTASPSDRSEQAHELALGKALAAQGGPTGRAGRPCGRLPGPFGEHGFDQVPRQDTGELPHRQDQLR